MEKPGRRGIKVLTTISLIGCSLQLISIIWAFFGARFSYEMAQAQYGEFSRRPVSGFMKFIMGDPGDMLEVARKGLENRIPICTLGLLAVGLCFYGVLLMRKMKREGFNYYVIGELLPVIISPLFVGTSAMSGFGFYLAILINIVFITLYAVRRGYMV